jgi:hypothetical protein
MMTDPRGPLERALAAYSSFSTYADEGITETTLEVGGESLPSTGYFETRFVRSKGLKFTCRERPPFSDHSVETVVCASERACTLWDSLSNVRHVVPDLKDALVQIILESQAASVIVPALLFGFSDLSDFLDLGDPVLESSAELDQAPVWLLQAQHVRLGLCRLWVDQATYAFRRIHFLEEGHSFSFSPRIDISIPDRELLPTRS